MISASGLHRGKLRLKWSLPAAFVLLMVLVAPVPALGAGICNAGDQIVLTRVELTQSCTVTGALTVHGGGQVVAAYTGNPNAVLRVEGNVLVGGDALLQVEGGTFEIQQDYNRHREMISLDRSTVAFKDTRVVLNQDSGLKYMVYNAFDQSKMLVADSQLDATNSWLLANRFGRSSLQVVNSSKLPTEIYVKEGATVRISGAETDVGVWLDFENGSTGTIDLPVQSDANDDTIPYSWRVGRGSPGFGGIPWLVEISDAKVGIGIESHGGSQLTVNGRGAPWSGELRIGYHVDSGTQTLTDLGVGLQNKILNGGQLTLNNVQLGRVSWQIYAHENDMLSIHNSVLNEIGVSAGGHITVYDSILQFAGLTSLGAGAASIEVHDSQIYSQAIEALRDGIVRIYDSPVHGASVVSHTDDSEVSFTGGAFIPNASEGCPLDLRQILDQWGVPRCNPFLAPGAEVSRAGVGLVSCNGTYDCDWVDSVADFRSASTPVPEPSSLLLLAAALCGIGLTRLPRQARSADPARCGAPRLPVEGRHVTLTVLRLAMYVRLRVP